MWLVVLLLIVAPLVELYVIIQVAHVIGGWETIALLVVESLIGAWLLKRQGLTTLDKISRAVNEARVPGKELIDGLLIIVAAALMLAPGFLGDIVGFLLLIPPTRALVRAPLMRKFSKGGFGFLGRTATAAGGAGGARWVGSFRVGDVYDTSGHDSSSVGPNGAPRLDP